MHWQINKEVYVHGYEFSTETCEFYYVLSRNLVIFSSSVLEPLTFSSSRLEPEHLSEFRVGTWNITGFWPGIFYGFQPRTWEFFLVPG